eukprot:281690-Pelagomonas_calceolata.AAC.3
MHAYMLLYHFRGECLSPELSCRLFEWHGTHREVPSKASPVAGEESHCSLCRPRCSFVPCLPFLGSEGLFWQLISQVEEGLCQLLAYVWLDRQHGKLSRDALQQRQASYFSYQIRTVAASWLWAGMRCSSARPPTPPTILRLPYSYLTITHCISFFKGRVMRNGVFQGVRKGAESGKYFREGGEGAYYWGGDCGVQTGHGAVRGQGCAAAAVGLRLYLPYLGSALSYGALYFLCTVGRGALQQNRAFYMSSRISAVEFVIVVM